MACKALIANREPFSHKIMTSAFGAGVSILPSAFLPDAPLKGPEDVILSLMEPFRKRAGVLLTSQGLVSMGEYGRNRVLFRARAPHYGC